jgi:malate dehydrogenase
MISIIGAGKVGSAAAFNVLKFRTGDVILVDVAEGLARGEALDMMQAAPAVEFDGKVVGTSDFSKIRGSDIVVITAGLARKPGMSRFDLATENSKIVKSVTKQVARYAPDCKLMVVTNPVDVMTYVACRVSGFDRHRVFGMGNILDTMRFRSYIAAELNVSREDVRALVIGEHGDTMVPLVNYASVSGIPIRDLLKPNQIDSIVRLTRTSGAEVINLKGATLHAPGVVIAIMVEAILRGRNRVLSVSMVLNGEYGQSDVSVGVPVVLGENGIERILELKLQSETQTEFEKSAAAVRRALGNIGSN